jgi:hypothetical protein
MVLNFLSVFNLNLELTAPECSIPDLGYDTKWGFVQMIPVAAALIFLLVHFVKYFQKRCIRGRKDRQKLYSHVDALFGTGLMLFYFLYLFITRMSLDVFNCSPTDPPDGHEYMDAVFVECYKEGGLHMKLLYYAIGTFLVYSVGYPLFVSYVLYKHRDKAKEDQLLRAMGTGDTRVTNPRTYAFRKRYHKMYYHFKPTSHAWILCIIARKFMIAFVALMFRKNAAFQLAVALLVLFISYAAQVRVMPYMSMSDRVQVLKHNENEASAGNMHAITVQQTLNQVAEIMKKRARSSRMSVANTKRGTSAVANIKSFVFNYNTVEAVLLFCAVLVCLSGIMFESGQLEGDYQKVQREILTWVVMIVVVASLCYFGAVFFSEVFVTLRPKSKKKKTLTTDEEADIKAIELHAVNPIFLERQKKKSESAEVRTDIPDDVGELQLEVQSLRGHVKSLQGMLTEAKKEAGAASVMARTQARPARGLRRMKHEFAPTAAKTSSGKPVAATEAAKASPMRRKSKRMSKAPQQEPDPSTIPDGWTAQFDPKHGRYVYE